jgi:hypothetical protein
LNDHDRREVSMASVSAVIDGAVAGAIATVAMSGVMLLGERAGVVGELPPASVTRHALRAAGVDRPSQAAAVLAPIAHLGFGAVGGALYAMVRRVAPGVPGPPLGVLFGLAVWAVSYKGWIPALGILPPPEDDRPGRPAVMVAAHVVYGLVLGRSIRP